TQNPHNMIKATFDALQELQSPRMVAMRRSRKVSDIVGRRDEEQAVEA
ncbi:MAG: 30S ribosomal protein S5, partial [Alphaproteobacteria bacterium]